MSEHKITLSPDLIRSMKELCEQNREITAISLCTTDGFIIKSFATKSLSPEADKLAAMSSTIAALSDSSTKILMQDEFTTTIIESDSGNTLFVRTRYLGTECVLMIAARIKMSLAMVRFNTKRLAQEISEITV